MANIEDCPGFETFGADVKAARQAKRISRKAMAEKINIDWRYLANIENDGAIPSLPVIIQLIKICGLPVERYHNFSTMDEDEAARVRAAWKPVIEKLPDYAYLCDEILREAQENEEENDIDL